MKTLFDGLSVSYSVLDLDIIGEFSILYGGGIKYLALPSQKKCHAIKLLPVTCHLPTNFKSFFAPRLNSTFVILSSLSVLHHSTAMTMANSTFPQISKCVVILYYEG